MTERYSPMGQSNSQQSNTLPYTHRLHYDTWAEMGKLEEKVRCGKKRPWSPIRTKWHFGLQFSINIIESVHIDTHTYTAWSWSQTLSSANGTLSLVQEKIKHHKKVSFSALAFCQFFMGSFSLAFYCKSIRVFGFLFFIFFVRPSIRMCSRQRIRHISLNRCWTYILSARCAHTTPSMEQRTAVNALWSRADSDAASFKQQTRSMWNGIVKKSDLNRIGPEINARDNVPGESHRIEQWLKSNDASERKIQIQNTPANVHWYERLAHTNSVRVLYTRQVLVQLVSIFSARNYLTGTKYHGFFSGR